MNKKNVRWLEIGYKHFAMFGPENLNIDRMAQESGLSRTSFYYHFDSLTTFIDSLLEKHVEEGKKIRSSVKTGCKNFIPDFIHIICNNRFTVIFNKQLSINRKVPEYLLAYNHFNNIVDYATLDLWAEDFSIRGDKEFLFAVFSMLRETFYNRITLDSLEYDTIKTIILDIRQLISKLITKS